MSILIIFAAVYIVSVVLSGFATISEPSNNLARDLFMVFAPVTNTLWAAMVAIMHMVERRAQS